MGQGAPRRRHRRRGLGLSGAGVDQGAGDDLRALLAQARERLASVPPVHLGLGRAAHPLKKLFGGEPVIEPVHEARHVGVLLIGDDDLWQVGDILRAAPLVRRGYTADAQRVRAYMQGMAFRGGFAEGEVCHIDWEPIDVDVVAAGGSSGPLSWRDGRLVVRWSPAGFLAPLADYLDERISLAQDPAAGAAD